MGKMIVVTGASGRVGHQVAEQLLSGGHAVRVIARNAEKLKPLAARGADVQTGSLDDRAFLTSMFRDASAAFLLTPVDLTARDVNAEQKKNVASIIAAVRESGIKNVVLLSSWGAELTEKSGGIIECHFFEEGLSEIPNLNAIYLRPVWFMENFLWNIGLIKMAGINGLSLDPSLLFPTIATCDIAPIASEYLASLDFKGKSVRYLNGPRDYTMIEVSRILGASVGKPNLAYVRFPDSLFKKGLVDNGGLSLNAANIAIEINQGMNSGRIHAEQRSKSNTTPTTLEIFAENTFAPAFRVAPDASFSARFEGMFLRSFLFATGHRAASLGFSH
jgi:uncharacterized protein YbjT (DUF2867 family)